MVKYSQNKAARSVPLWNERQPWRSLNDAVMGGQSDSTLKCVGGQLWFKGCISVAGGGGFASVRRAMRLPAQAKQLCLRVFGDGRSYQLRLKMDRQRDGVIYIAQWTPPAGYWSQVQFVEASFEPRFRGRRLSGQAPLQFEQVQQLGLLTGERQPGCFCLRLDSILSVHSNVFSGSDVLDPDPEVLFNQSNIKLLN
ncbi:Complex I intermediate-associated protein 30 (CIA30) [Ferrimonas sediminum]|uniref:Complex I intermediate-associated protein 30 (CIA30) n=1 Tax=Ferrimonas sediminum TaxID=718193 RepID=A0A1G8WP58_9GAMM|nr:CIA30 family protein [Ferrimonas sediminum]SDJ79405.1 Complex I intermediate-associated protein 30 (CIA30) [Ferrimonas sediminum]